jgi:hypothetical protein
VVLLQFVHNLIHNRPQVRLARARHDHEVVRDRRQLTHIKDDDVFRLLVVRQFAAKQRQFSRIHLVQ